jgi:hypothetical protein
LTGNSGLVGLHRSMRFVQVANVARHVASVAVAGRKGARMHRDVGPVNGVPVMEVLTGQNSHSGVTATGIARFPVKIRYRPGRVPLQVIRAVLASSACAESAEEIKATHFHCVETCHPTQKPGNCACLQCSNLLLASCILVCPGNRSSKVFSFSSAFASSTGEEKWRGASKGKSQCPSRLVRTNPRTSPCVLRFSSRANSIEPRAKVTHLRPAKHRRRT